MKLILTLTLLITAVAAGPAATGEAVPASTTYPTTSRFEGQDASATQVPLPATGAETLRVFVGRTLVLRAPEELKRVSVTDPAIAAAVIVAPDQIMIHGLKPGTVTLLLWDQQEQLRSFDLIVQLDVRNLAASIRQILPKEAIDVSGSGAAVVLTGDVTNQAVADKAVALAQTEAATVVNMMRIRAQGNETVMLQVRFAEVDRSAVQQLGVNLFSTGGGNTIGSTSTQQFGALLGNVGGVPSGTTKPTQPQTSSSASGAIGQATSGTPSVFGLSDLLNIFLFRPDVNLGAVIRALQQKNTLQILAEPNLLAVNGKEASFLAGGEFPFPVVQGGTNFTSVTIMFKEFGIRLRFTANVQEEGAIRLKVAPEVSSLDFSNALTISGFLVPALSTRRADTEVVLHDGQSFAIAGLLDNRLTEIASKVPWLGDVPVLGKLFRSRSFNRNNSELMVLVTPTVVKALEPGQVPPPPAFPEPFLSPEKFDGKTGPTPPPAAAKAPVKK